MNETEAHEYVPEFRQHIQEKALHIADYLDALNPYERDLVLDEAHTIWYKRRAETPAEQAAADADAEVRASITKFLIQVVRRLEPEALADLVEMFREINDESRLRLLQGYASTTDMDNGAKHGD